METFCLTRRGHRLTELKRKEPRLRDGNAPAKSKARKLSVDSLKKKEPRLRDGNNTSDASLPGVSAVEKKSTSITRWKQDRDFNVIPDEWIVLKRKAPRLRDRNLSYDALVIQYVWLKRKEPRFRDGNLNTSSIVSSGSSG